MSEEAKTQTEEVFNCFVGNISFNTTAEALTSLFTSSEVGAEVVHVNIVQHGTRPLGYCFVSCKTQEQAKKAAEKLNGTTFGDRVIKVEVAKPESEREPRKPRAPKSTEPRKAQAAAPASGEEGAETKAKKARKPRGPRRKKSTTEGEDGVAAITEGVAESHIDGNKTVKAPRERKPREPREPRGTPAGPPSKTTVFVANLPFTTTDEILTSIFTEKNVKVKTAHVVTRKFGVKRSKGFGFVDCVDEESQKAALAVDGFEVDGRALSVKIAIEEQHKATEAETAAAAETTTA